MPYSEKLMDHYENPRNVGTLDKNDESVGTGMVGAPACGDVMRLQIKVNDEGVIEDAKFKTYGCGSAIASSSLVSEWVKGKTLDEAAKISNAEIAEELALPPVKIHCSILAEDAVKLPLTTTRPSTPSKPKSTLFTRTYTNVSHSYRGGCPPRFRFFDQARQGHRFAPGRQDERLLGHGLQA